MTTRARGGGRKRTPTKLKLVRGTYRKDRATPNEPEPEMGIPAYARGLSEKSKIHWDEVGEELNKMRILTTADRWLLRLLSDKLVDYDEGLESLKKNPKIIAGNNKDGSPILITNPYVKIVRDSWNQILTALREFGLTPSSRTHISSIPDPDKDNPWANL